jgi:hypothetical protein
LIRFNLSSFFCCNLFHLFFLLIAIQKKKTKRCSWFQSPEVKQKQQNKTAKTRNKKQEPNTKANLYGFGFEGLMKIPRGPIGWGDSCRLSCS